MEQVQSQSTTRFRNVMEACESDSREGLARITIEPPASRNSLRRFSLPIISLGLGEML